MSSSASTESFPSQSSPSRESRHFYFRVPTPGSLYPLLNREETLAAIVDTNKSLPSKNRLPAEILALINDEIHTVDSVYADIRSKWTPLVESIDIFSLPQEQLWIGFDTNKKRFSIYEEYNRIADGDIDISFVLSAADLLYRVRCLFPDVLIDTGATDKYKSVWTVWLRHNQSGILINFTEHKGWAQVLREDEKKNGNTVFTEDTLQLLNTLFGTVDGKRFTYYHPTAYADLPTSNQRYLAVPDPNYDFPDYDIGTYRRISKPYYQWLILFPTPVEDLGSSTFKSLLPRLKYNPMSRKVDLENGTEDLTTIMSSSLLFYRLLCHWTMDSINLNDKHPITSLWQVELQHHRYDVYLLFLDDRGSFDIRVEGDESKVMDDIIALVTLLFSDDCRHPYGCLAGSFYR